MSAVIDFLERLDPELARRAHRRYACLEPWAQDLQHYGRSALVEGYARCETAVVEMLMDLLDHQLDCYASECDEWLDAAANARLVKDAKAYYRAMYPLSAESWIQDQRGEHCGFPLFLLDLCSGDASGDLHDALCEPRLERFIGVIYRPETERWSHYNEAIVARQFDAWLWFDTSRSVSPLNDEA